MLKTVEAHQAEAVVRPDATILVGEVPFAAGDKVKIIVLREEAGNARRHSDDEIESSKRLRQSMRGCVLRYDNPTDPIGVEDWDALQDDKG